MSARTGIELGPESCVLVGVKPAGTVLDVSAVHVIPPAAWPSQDVALAETLKAARRGKGFPRSARVIAWGLPEPLSPDDPVARDALRPISAAGFRIDAVLSPSQALARLAASRQRTPKDATILWLAVNMHGAAMAVVQNDRVLFSRTFDWTYRRVEMGTKAELLQRYSLVAHLAPEVRQAIATVRTMHGATVEAAVTCGDLPELRSLTMPLIEELDIEVETLDSPAGLRPRGRANDSRFAEVAPAIRLACAAATAPAERKRPMAALVRAAAVIVCGLGVGVIGYGYWSGALGSASRKVAPAKSQTTAVQRPLPAPTPSAREQKGGSPPSALEKGGSPPSLPKSVAAPLLTVQQKLQPSPVQPVAKVPVVPQPVAQEVKAVTNRTSASIPPPPEKGGSPPSLTRSVAAPLSPAPAPAPAEPARPLLGRPAELELQARKQERPAVQVPLKDPLPRVDSILIDQDRRLAIIDGEILGVGDAVGQRVIASIESRSVIFREPSGLAIRVSLGTGTRDPNW